MGVVHVPGAIQERLEPMHESMKKLNNPAIHLFIYAMV